MVVPIRTQPHQQSPSLQSQKSSPNPTGTNNKPLHSNRELASHIAEAELVIIPSSDGHAGFLPEVERINLCLVGFLRRELYARTEGREGVFDEVDRETGDFETKNMSAFGEAKVDGARW